MAHINYFDMEQEVEKGWIFAIFLCPNLVPLCINSHFISLRWHIAPYFVTEHGTGILSLCLSNTGWISSDLVVFQSPPYRDPRWSQILASHNHDRGITLNKFFFSWIKLTWRSHIGRDISLCIPSQVPAIPFISSKKFPFKKISEGHVLISVTIPKGVSPSCPPLLHSELCGIVIEFIVLEHRHDKFIYFVTTYKKNQVLILKSSTLKKISFKRPSGLLH